MKGMTFKVSEDARSRYRGLLVEYKSIMEKTFQSADPDWEAIGFVAHKLKGSAAMYGYPELTEMADRLGYGAKLGVRDDVLKAMTEVCTRIDVILDQTG